MNGGRCLLMCRKMTHHSTHQSQANIIQHYKSLDHKYPNHKSVDHKSHDHNSPEHTTTLNTSPGHNSPDHKFVDQNYPHYTSLILTSPNHQSHILKSHLSTSLDRTSADPTTPEYKEPVKPKPGPSVHAPHSRQPCSDTYDNSAHPNSPMHHLLFQGVEIFEPIGHDPPSKVKPIYDSSTHHVSPKPALFPFPPQPITSTPLPQKIADFLNMINQSTLLINHHIKA